jgi:uncharacterized protein (TIGR03083 family)
VGCRPAGGPGYGRGVTDWGALYGEHVDALSALAPTLSDEQRATTVPGTPAWTVHEVLAHLAGVASDMVTGRMDGAPGPEWTSRHVSERAQLPVLDLMDELRSRQDAIAESVVDNPRPASVWNMAVHHADLHEALDLPRMPGHLWLPIVEALAERMPEGLADRVPPYELFRACFSRRSRAQMQAWGTDLSAEELDDMCIFGPREDDQPAQA